MAGVASTTKDEKHQGNKIKSIIVRIKTHFFTITPTFLSPHARDEILTTSIYNVFTCNLIFS
jgi:hypothetical protein